MQLVQHCVIPCAASPTGVRPGVRAGVDNLARLLQVFGLKARCRIGHSLAVGKNEAVSGAGAGSIGRKFVPAFSDRLEWQMIRLADDREICHIQAGGPESKADLPIGLHFRSVLHAVNAGGGVRRAAGGPFILYLGLFVGGYRCKW